MPTACKHRIRISRCMRAMPYAARSRTRARRSLHARWGAAHAAACGRREGREQTLPYTRTHTGTRDNVAAHPHPTVQPSTESPCAGASPLASAMHTQTSPRPHRRQALCRRKQNASEAAVLSYADGAHCFPHHACSCERPRSSTHPTRRRSRAHASLSSRVRTPLHRTAAETCTPPLV